MKFTDSKPLVPNTIFIWGVHKSYAESFESIVLNEGFNIVYSEEFSELLGYLELRSPQAIIFENPSMDLSKSKIIEIRKMYSGIIILLTDRKDAKYHILCLELGADEIINKSLSVSALIGRLKILLGQKEAEINSKNKNISIGEIRINGARREVFMKNKLVKINSIEFDILWCLITNSGKTVSRYAFHKALYDSDYNGFERSLDIYISRIRFKLCDNPRDPKYIKTVRSGGYLFLPSEQS